jgi:hypothetical protein
VTIIRTRHLPAAQDVRRDAQVLELAVGAGPDEALVHVTVLDARDWQRVTVYLAGPGDIRFEGSQVNRAHPGVHGVFIRNGWSILSSAMLAEEASAKVVELERGEVGGHLGALGGDRAPVVHRHRRQSRAAELQVVIRRVTPGAGDVQEDVLAADARRRRCGSRCRWRRSRAHGTAAQLPRARAVG